MVVDASERFSYRVNPFDFEQARALRAQAPPASAPSVKRSAALPMLSAPSLPDLSAIAERRDFLDWADFEAVELDAIAELLAADSHDWRAYCEADARASADDDNPTIISERGVERTRKRHSCYVCRGDIEPGEPATVRTLQVGAAIRSGHVCYGCDAGSASNSGGNAAASNGCKLFEETQGEY